MRHWSYYTSEFPSIKCNVKDGTLYSIDNCSCSGASKFHCIDFYVNITYFVWNRCVKVSCFYLFLKFWLINFSGVDTYIFYSVFLEFGGFPFKVRKEKNEYIFELLYLHYLYYLKCIFLHLRLGEGVTNTKSLKALHWLFYVSNDVEYHIQRYMYKTDWMLKSRIFSFWRPTVPVCAFS